MATKATNPAWEWAKARAGANGPPGGDTPRELLDIARSFAGIGERAVQQENIVTSSETPAPAPAPQQPAQAEVVTMPLDQAMNMKTPKGTPYSALTIEQLQKIPKFSGISQEAAEAAMIVLNLRQRELDDKNIPF